MPFGSPVVPYKVAGNNDDKQEGQYQSLLLTYLVVKLLNTLSVRLKEITEKINYTLRVEKAEIWTQITGADFCLHF